MMEAYQNVEKTYKIGGYVKRAKLNLRNEKDIRAFHRKYYEDKFGCMEDGDLVDVYIDITGYKETAKRPEMLRLKGLCRRENQPDCSRDQRIPCCQHAGTELLASLHIQFGPSRGYHHGRCAVQYQYCAERRSSTGSTKENGRRLHISESA